MQIGAFGGQASAGQIAAPAYSFKSANLCGAGT